MGKTIVRAKQIPIKPSRSFKRRFGSREYDGGMQAWTKAAAFAVNPRGVLTHRVRHVTTYLRGKKPTHHHIDYVCGNGCNVSLSDIDDVLVSDPPEERLLCDGCERRALLFKLPTGDQLAGRHVHRGVLVPQQVCCCT